jgi:hypothetical protein
MLLAVEDCLCGTSSAAVCESGHTSQSAESLSRCFPISLHLGAFGQLAVVLVPFSFFAPPPRPCTTVEQGGKGCVAQAVVDACLWKPGNPAVQVCCCCLCRVEKRSTLGLLVARQVWWLCVACLPGVYADESAGSGVVGGVGMLEAFSVLLHWARLGAW